MVSLLGWRSLQCKVHIQVSACRVDTVPPAYTINMKAGTSGSGSTHGSVSIQGKAGRASSNTAAKTLLVNMVKMFTGSTHWKPQRPSWRRRQRRVDAMFVQHLLPPAPYAWVMTTQLFMIEFSVGRNCRVCCQKSTIACRNALLGACPCLPVMTAWLLITDSQSERFAACMFGCHQEEYTQGRTVKLCPHPGC